MLSNAPAADSSARDARSEVVSEDPDDPFAGDILDEAVKIAQQADSFDAAVHEHQANARRGLRRVTDATCPECDGSVHPAANRCESCKLSFRKGFCAVCGESVTSGKGKRRCKHKARIVVWNKKASRGLCTNCGEVTVQTGGVLSKGRDCVRCAVDHRIRRDLDKAESSVGVDATASDADARRIRLLRRKIERMEKRAERLNEQAEAAVTKDSFLGAAVKTIFVSALFGETILTPPGQSRDADADEKVEKTQERLTELQSLLMRMHIATENRYINASENWQQNFGKYLGLGCLGIIVFVILLIGAIALFT